MNAEQYRALVNRLEAIDQLSEEVAPPDPTTQPDPEWTEVIQKLVKMSGKDLATVRDRVAAVRRENPGITAKDLMDPNKPLQGF